MGRYLKSVWIVAIALSLGGCGLTIDWNDWSLDSLWRGFKTKEQAAAAARPPEPPAPPPPLPTLAQPPRPAAAQSQFAAMPAAATMAKPADLKDTEAPMSSLPLQPRLPWPFGYAFRKMALDERNAAIVLRDAALRGDGFAIGALALVHEKGIGVEANSAVGHLWLGLLKEHAAAGNLSAQTALGVMHRYGFATPRDLVQAKQWLTRAGEKNEPIALVELGLMQRDGIGDGPSAEKAAQWFKRAAEVGSPAGAVELARAIEEGKGATANPARAAKLYDWAGRQGYGPGDFRLAILHRDGKGVKLDPVEALARFMIAERMSTDPSIQEGAAKGVADLRAMLNPGQLAEAETRAERLAPR